MFEFPDLPPRRRWSPSGIGTIAASVAVAVALTATAWLALFPPRPPVSAVAWAVYAWTALDLDHAGGRTLPGDLRRLAARFRRAATPVPASVRA